MALVAKILETTLTAGQTTVSFNDSDIHNSLIRVFTTNPDLFPIQQSLSGNVLTVAFEAQSSNVGVALEIVKQGLTVADNLTTESSDQALSAKQGYVLKGLIDNIVIPTVPENIIDLDDVAVSDIQDGQVLAWDSVTEKFKNVNQSGGGSSVDYSTTEQKIGTWTDGSDLYQITYIRSYSELTTDGVLKVFNIPNLSNITIRNMFGHALSSTYGYCQFGGRNYSNNQQSGAYFEFINYYGLPTLKSSVSLSDLNNKSPDITITIQYTKNS